MVFPLFHFRNTLFGWWWFFFFLADKVRSNRDMLLDYLSFKFKIIYFQFREWHFSLAHQRAIHHKNVFSI